MIATLRALREKIDGRINIWHGRGGTLAVGVEELEQWVAELDTVLAQATESQEKLEIRLKLAERAHERLNLCLDHRDKTNGRCIVCVAEERTRKELRGESVVSRPAKEEKGRIECECGNPVSFAVFECCECGRQWYVHKDDIPGAVVSRSGPREWQSISTAPKDKILFLYDANTRNHYVGWWYPGGGFNGEGCFAYEGESIGFSRRTRPTHWMLPTVPGATPVEATSPQHPAINLAEMARQLERAEQERDFYHRRADGAFEMIQELQKQLKGEAPSPLQSREGEPT